MIGLTMVIIKPSDVFATNTGYIADTKTTILLDTCSSFNFMSEDFARHIRNQYTTKERTKSKLANGLRETFGSSIN
jgi:hypothetical protein